MDSSKKSIVLALTILFFTELATTRPSHHYQAERNDRPEGIGPQNPTTAAAPHTYSTETHDRIASQASNYTDDGQNSHDGEAHGATGHHGAAGHHGKGADSHHDGKHDAVEGSGDHHEYKLPQNPVVDYLTKILSHHDVWDGLLQSLGSSAAGPYLLRPVAEMLCRALVENSEQPVMYHGDGIITVSMEDTPENCDVDAAVVALQKAVEHIKDMGPSLSALPIQAVYEPMHEVFSALTHAESLGVDVLQAAFHKLGTDDLGSLPGFQEGIAFILESGHRKSQLEPQTIMPSKLSIVQGALRLLLSDRDFEKTLFQAAHDSQEVVACVAKYFFEKYGVVENQEVAEEIVKETLEGLLQNWDNRAAMFEIMKLGFTRLTGKHMPLPFIMYSGLIDGIKSGAIELPAILGYMEMAKLNPAFIEKFASYDSQAYSRFKHIYVPIYMFVREYFRDAAHGELHHSEQ